METRAVYTYASSFHAELNIDININQIYTRSKHKSFGSMKYCLGQGSEQRESGYR